MLIIGLGNPGKKYENTRHSVGYMVIDRLKEERLDNLILAKTDTFMNLSGQSVRSLTKRYTLNANNLIIVHDDIDLPIGEFKIQKGRGAAGHKGVQSIINELGTKDFWRIRIGISPKGGPSTSLRTSKPENVEKFVLQKFSKEEKEILEKVIEEINKKLGLFPQLS